MRTLVPVITILGSLLAWVPACNTRDLSECSSDRECGHGYVCERQLCELAPAEDAGDAEEIGTDPSADVASDPNTDDTSAGPDVDVISDASDAEADPDADAGVDPLDAADADVCVPSEEVCDGVDNDCDGEIDAADSDFEPRPCTQQAGVCEDAVFTCVGGVEVGCELDDLELHAARESGGPFQPGTETVCDSLDNDCDGVADEGCCAFDGGAPPAPEPLLGVVELLEQPTRYAFVRADQLVAYTVRERVTEGGEDTTSIVRLAYPLEGGWPTSELEIDVGEHVSDRSFAVCSIDGAEEVLLVDADGGASSVAIRSDGTAADAVPLTPFEDLSGEVTAVIGSAQPDNCLVVAETFDSETMSRTSHVFDLTERLTVRGSLSNDVLRAVGISRFGSQELVWGMLGGTLSISVVNTDFSGLEEPSFDIPESTFSSYPVLWRNPDGGYVTAFGTVQDPLEIGVFEFDLATEYNQAAELAAGSILAAGAPLTAGNYIVVYNPNQSSTAITLGGSGNRTVGVLDYFAGVGALVTSDDRIFMLGSVRLADGTLRVYATVLDPEGIPLCLDR